MFYIAPDYSKVTAYISKNLKIIQMETNSNKCIMYVLISFFEYITVPLIDQQFHIPTSTPLQLAPIPTQIQSQLQPQISQIPIHNQPQIQIQSQVQPQLPTQSQPKPSSKASLDTSSNAFKKYVNPFAPEATVPLPVELEDQYGPYR